MSKFLDSIKPHAIAGYSKSKILPSIVGAQAILESASGTSDLAKKANNLFGIKGDYNGESYSKNTQEWQNGKFVTVKAAFRKYSSYLESILDHGSFFTSSAWRTKNYASVLKASDYKTQAKALQESGYATDPEYANKLIRVIESEGLSAWDKEVGKQIADKVHLIVAGHGGSDPGAVGNGTNERDFTRTQVVDRLAKFINATPGHKAVIYDKKNNMYWDTQSGQGYGMYWAADQNFASVTELHLDAAGNVTATGAHVIVQGGLIPDAIDLGIRDVLQEYVGIRYTHKGHSGISGRFDLLQVNVAAEIGVNYRLVEMGFITNANDFRNIVNNLDAITRGMANAITGGTSSASNGTSAIALATPVKSKVSKLTGGTYTVVSGDSLSAIAKRAGTTTKNLQSINGIANADLIFPGQVIKLKGSKSPNATNTNTYTVKSGENLSTIAQRNNTTTAALQRLNNIQNANLIFPGQVLKLGASVKAPSKKKTVDAVAKEVIKGLWNDDPERSKRLVAAGYDANAVQRRVNQLL